MTSIDSEPFFKVETLMIQSSIHQIKAIFLSPTNSSGHRFYPAEVLRSNPSYFFSTGRDFYFWAATLRII